MWLFHLQIEQQQLNYSWTNDQYNGQYDSNIIISTYFLCDFLFFELLLLFFLSSLVSFISNQNYVICYLFSLTFPIEVFVLTLNAISVFFFLCFESQFLLAYFLVSFHLSLLILFFMPLPITFILINQWIQNELIFLVCWIFLES